MLDMLDGENKSPMSPLVAFIIGSGANVGKHVADKLRSQGYRVALGSRNPKVQEEDTVGVTVDITKTDSILKAFEEVNTRLGAPNVVIFNAGHFAAPPDPADPLSLPFETFNESVGVVASAYVAAQEALKGFRAHHKESPRVFITTGNMTPFANETHPLWLTIGTQKVAEAFYMHLFSEAYAKEGVRFHYAHYVGDQGNVDIEGFGKSGGAHAKAFWDLISSKESLPWDYRFTMNGNQYNGH